ncbi:uncharacterized protein M6B38_303730 [Iris pallida]|uniref:Amino acid transporter transmembrane domain-containing protein n=1 Tax=Iris pallida TaxID=29817 RepID=A0AAX6HNR2_IRIPA|nr:uncharacterized protein M6B38_303730 [Iris pallida]
MKTPLLPELLHAPVAGDSGTGASVSGAVFNLSTSIVGAGIMSIPATLKVLGVGPALLLIAAVAFLSDASVEFLVRYTGHSGAPVASYAGLMGESFGRAGSAALQLCVVVTNLGALIMYLIVIGDVLSGNGSEGSIHSGILNEWFGEHWWNERSVALLITLVIMMPLLLLKRVDSLRFTSAVSVLLAVVFVIISSAMALCALYQGTTQTPRLLPNFANQSFFHLFTAIPVLVVAFTFHFNVHPIRAELSRTSDMAIAVRISLLLCSAIYASVGFFGYLLFGDSTMADILSNFDQSSTGSQIGPWLNDVVRLSYALHLVLVFPLLNYSLRLNIDEMLFPKSRPFASDTGRFVSLTGVLMVVVYSATIAIPNIWVLFQYMGSTSAVCLSLIFPAAIVLRDIHGISKRRDKILAATMIILAVVTSSIAISTNISGLFKGENK